MTTGVTVITVTTTRTHTGLKTPTGGLMVGMTAGLGRRPLFLQHRHRLSLSTAMSSAGFTEGRTASSAQNTVPNVAAVHSTVKVCEGH